jgi:hypothetical protein
VPPDNSAQVYCASVFPAAIAVALVIPEAVTGVVLHAEPEKGCAQI